MVDDIVEGQKFYLKGNYSYIDRLIEKKEIRLEYSIHRR